MDFKLWLNTVNKLHNNNELVPADRTLISTGLDAIKKSIKEGARVQQVEKLAQDIAAHIMKLKGQRAANNFAEYAKLTIQLGMEARDKQVNRFSTQSLPLR